MATTSRCLWCFFAISQALIDFDVVKHQVTNVPRLGDI